MGRACAALIVLISVRLVRYLFLSAFMSLYPRMEGKINPLPVVQASSVRIRCSRTTTLHRRGNQNMATTTVLHSGNATREMILAADFDEIDFRAELNNGRLALEGILADQAQLDSIPV